MSYVETCSCVLEIAQVAQLSQRDRVVGWVSYGQKWKTGTGRTEVIQDHRGRYQL